MRERKSLESGNQQAPHVIWLSSGILDDPFSFNFIFHCAEVDDTGLNNMIIMAESHIVIA